MAPEVQMTWSRRRTDERRDLRARAARRAHAHARPGTWLDRRRIRDNRRRAQTLEHLRDHARIDRRRRRVVEIDDAAVTARLLRASCGSPARRRRALHGRQDAAQDVHLVLVERRPVEQSPQPRHQVALPVRSRKSISSSTCSRCVVEMLHVRARSRAAPAARLRGNGRGRAARAAARRRRPARPWRG